MVQRIRAIESSAQWILADSQQSVQVFTDSTTSNFSYSESLLSEVVQPEIKRQRIRPMPVLSRNWLSLAMLVGLGAAEAASVTTHLQAELKIFILAALLVQCI